MTHLHLATLDCFARVRASMLLVLLSAIGAWTQGLAQESSLTRAMVGADLIASETEACPAEDPVVEFVNFQIDEATLSNPAVGIVEVQWVISRNGSPALPSEYALDEAVGANLADWNEQTTLSFAPLTNGTFEVSGDVIWASISQNLEPAVLDVGAVPAAPNYTIPETAFCDLGGELDVASSVLTPNNIQTDLCATVFDKATNAALPLANVSCESSGANPTAVTNNFLVTTLNAGCYLLELEATNRCGATSVAVDIDVLGTPNFSLSLTPFCESDSEAVIVSDFNLTFTDCDNNLPSLEETWTLQGDAINVESANQFPLPDSLGYTLGDVVCQTIDLGYAIGGGDSLHCAAQSCKDIFYFPAAAIEWQVTYPITFPPVCSGDDIEIEVISPPSNSSHEWLSTPLPDALSSSNPGVADCIGNLPSNNVASYLTLDTNGVSGTIVRTTCHIAPDLSTATCVTDTTFEIDVAPKPSIAWVDSVSSVTACAYETNTSLSIQIESENPNPSDWVLTWTVITDDGDSTDIVQTVSDQQILNGATLSLSLNQVIASCFNGNPDQVTSFDVEVSARNESGCESEVLLGSMILYAAPAPSAIFEAICEGWCLEPQGVNADGGLDFQWFLDNDSCDGVDEIPSDIEGAICSTPYPWDLTGSGFVAFSTNDEPEFCDVTCNSTVGMRLQQSWPLPTVEDGLLQCTSPLVRFDVEVVPSPELQIATEGALCDNLEQFTFSATNCNDVNFDAVTEPCVDCPVTTCESCVSQTTTISDWKYSIDGGSSFVGSSFPNPALAGAVVSIDATTLTSGLNPIYLRVTANTSSPNNPILSCETIDTVSFNWHEAPTLDALTLPDYLCPGSEYMLEAEAENANGSEEQLCFLWEECLEDSTLDWNFTGPACFNDDCGIAQGEGVRNSEASITLPLDMEPCLDVCFDLTITDNVGCQVDTSFSLDVRGLPSVEGLTVMEAFGSESSITALDPPCAIPGPNNTNPSECSGSQVLTGDTTNAFCAGSEYLLKAEGVEGGCEDPSSMGGGTGNMLNYHWQVYDAVNDPTFVSNLVSQQDTCGRGATPTLPCLPSYLDAPSAALSVYLTLEETNGCNAQFEWLDTLTVFPAPCIALTSSNQYCEYEEPELEICGPQTLAFCCTGSLQQPSVNAAGCFDVVFPQACLSGINAGPFYGSNTYSIGDESITCKSREEFALDSINPPSTTLVIEDTSFDPTDTIACEGGDFTLEVTALIQEGTLSYAWSKESDGTSSVLGNNATLVLPATLEEGGDCQVLTVCEGEVVVTTTLASGLACHDTTDWKVYVRPTPTFTLTSEGNNFCDQDSIALCASRDCSIGDAPLGESWTWATDPVCDESPTSNPPNNPCWAFEAIYQGVPGDGLFESSKVISLTDSYGCAWDTTFDYTVHERPDLGITASFVCEGENVDVEVNGADVYTFDFDPQDSIETTPPIFAPGNAVTGDFIQQLDVLTPDSGDVLGITGTLTFPLGADSVFECSTDTSIHVVVYPLPVITPSLDPDGPYCEADSVTFHDENDASDWVPPLYDFVPSSGTSELETLADSFAFGLQPPFTDLVVTKILNYDSAGIVTTCEANWDTTLVVVANPEVVLDAAAGICQEDSTSVVCSISNALLDAMYTHTWYVNDAGVLSGVIPGEEGTVTEAYVASSMPETNEDPANIQVWCEVADSIGCSATDTLVIEAVATPNLEWITPLPDDVCSPSLACVDVGVTNDLNPLPQINVLWANPNGIATDPCFLFQNNTLCPNVEDISATVQLVHLLAAGGTQVCESSIRDSLVVNPTPSPAFLLGAPQACWDTANAVCIDILHDVENYALCEDDAYTYNWFVTPSAGLSAADVTIDDANSPVPEVCITEPGTVDLILEIENAYGCSQTTPSQPFVVRDLPNPTLTFTQSDGICMPTTVEINATSIGASDFTMFIEDYGTFENFNSPLVLPVEFPGYRNVEFVVSKAHTSPSILGYDNDGNPISTDNVIVCEVETTYVAAFEGVIPPTAAFSVLPSNTVDLSNGLIQFINESEGQVENIWIFGDGDESGSSEVNPEHQYTATGEYLVELAVVNDRGCTDYAEDVIRVREDLFMYVPNAFTPARGGEGGFADNLNDSWFPSIEGTNAIESYEVCVFNRTGHRVWCSQDPNHPAGEQWDGTGPEGTHLVQTGVYTWRISLKKKNGQGADVYTGQVSVIR